jgi:hypothetical protein
MSLLFYLAQTLPMFLYSNCQLAIIIIKTYFGYYPIGFTLNSLSV